jgi:hypothetical protein
MRASNTSIDRAPERDPAAAAAAATARWQAIAEVFSVASGCALDEAATDLVVHDLIAALDGLVGRAAALIREVQAAIPEPADELDDLFATDPAAAGSILPPPAPRSLVDVCFAAILELGQARRGLGAQLEASERAVAFETTRRRLCQTLIVVLEAAGQRALIGEHAQPEDLSAALRLRSRYAAFRRALRPTASSSEADVLTAVRYAAGAIAQLVSSTDFAIARAADRAVLRGLRDRMLAWARTDKSALAGLRILSDVAACADLLHGINRRQELRGHDLALLVGLRAGPTGDLVAWIADLRRLDGLDDELDALTAQAEADRGGAATVAAIVARLEVLA